MIREELKQILSNSFPSVSFDETGEFLTALLPAEEVHALMQELKTNSGLDFDFLFCLTCIDWKDHLMMVYHLLSKQHKHELVVKAKIADTTDPEIETVTGLWKTAIFHEREVFDLFGVRFINHPDMRRIFLDENWEGYPLRKNYVDENMITI